MNVLRVFHKDASNKVISEDYDQQYYDWDMGDLARERFSIILKSSQAVVTEIPADKWVGVMLVSV